MRLKSIQISNFRALDEISMEFDSSKRVNVIVGPNAVGKTTILEAIRLPKAVLSPRTNIEAQQVLTALGAISPHLPQQVNFASLARDVSKKVEIRTKYEITSEEEKLIEGSLSLLANTVIQARFGQAANGPVALVQYLSTPAGKDDLAKVNGELGTELQKLKCTHVCNLSLIIDPIKSQMYGEEQLAQLMLGLLDSLQPTYQTLFSYFPADRAMPTGDVGIQIGPNDIGPQLESHNSQPQTKYQRLKNVVFNNLLQGPEQAKQLKEDFEHIFATLLKGRKLGDIGINQFGLFKFTVEDTNTHRVFDLDGMSSGEKGLILTFLLIGRSLSENGLLLLDEPELHLNPAVCKAILPFLIERYCIPKNLQAVICTHSAEILAGAFGRDDCELYHLVSDKVISKVSRSDRDEVVDALSRLGVSEEEELLYQGTVFVEGDQDVELLEEGFGDLLGRYCIKDLGGRREVEKQIESLQAAENEGKVSTPRYFIFDRDSAPTGLKNSTYVKILQWERYCFENYLLDFDAIYEVFRDADNANKPIQRRGESKQILEELALSQLVDTVAREIYDKRGYKTAGVKVSDVEKLQVSQIADLMFERIGIVVNQFSGFNGDKWKAEFINECQAEIERRKPDWTQNWQRVCNGKRLLRDLHRRVSAKIGESMLKKRILAAMRAANQTPAALAEARVLITKMLER